MNAVKRCLALFAATLVVGACSGDPTAGDAGTGLFTRTTPSVVWMREDQTLQIDVEAIDVLGGNSPGSWTVTSTGPFTIALDTEHQETSTGGISQIRRYIITPTAAGEGSVTFTGVGDPVVVPVRIAPDPLAFAVTVSDAAPVIGDTVTITAPAGTRFTSATTVNFYNGPTTLDLQQGATPLITAIDGADSSVLHFVPPAGAEGQLLVTRIANVSTPALTVEARTVTSFTLVDTRDLTATYSTGNTIAANTPVTVTLTQAPYRFRDGAGGAPDTTHGTFPMPGSGAGVEGIVGRVLDSTNAIIYLPPRFDAPPVLDALFHPAQSFYNLRLPLADSMHVGDLPAGGVGDDDAIGGTVGTITLPAMVVGESYAFWDNGTFQAPNVVNLGGPQQWIEVVFTTAGTYTITASWDNGADVDNYLIDGTISTFLADCGTCGTNPEVLEADLGAGENAFLAQALFDGTRPGRVRVVITRSA